jgi:uncharacterized protein (DUF1810 family)
MTLFAEVSDDERFRRAIARYYAAGFDQATLDILRGRPRRR